MTFPGPSGPGKRVFEGGKDCVHVFTGMLPLPVTCLYPTASNRVWTVIMASRIFQRSSSRMFYYVLTFSEVFSRVLERSPQVLRMHTIEMRLPFYPRFIAVNHRQHDGATHPSYKSDLDLTLSVGGSWSWIFSFTSVSSLAAFLYTNSRQNTWCIYISYK